jgi:hypothetical protein
METPQTESSKEFLEHLRLVIDVIPEKAMAGRDITGQSDPLPMAKYWKSQSSAITLGWNPFRTC